MAEYTAYFNGGWVPYSQAKLDLGDRGFRVADNVFDLARSFNGKSFRMREHIDRLYRSLKYVRIDPGLSADEMLEISEETLRRNEHLRADVGDYTIGQYVTRGSGWRAWDPSPPTVIVKARPVSFGLWAQAYDSGMRAVVARSRSYPPEALDPKIKHHSRMNFNLAELEANDVDPGALPILLDMEGNLSEGSGYNVLIVTDGAIRTAGDRAVLQGVSRGMVFDLAKQLDIPVVEEDLQPYDLYNADEVFFSSTSYCILPVTQVDRRPIGDGKPGPVVQQLLAAWSEAVGVDIVDQALQFADNK